MIERARNALSLENFSKVKEMAKSDPSKTWSQKQTEKYLHEKSETRVRTAMEVQMQVQELERMMATQRAMRDALNLNYGDVYYDAATDSVRVKRQPVFQEDSRGVDYAEVPEDSRDEAYETYHDAEGRVFRKPPENKIKATVHKAGHFPIEWMVEASNRANDSDFLIHIEVNATGVEVIGHQGDEYATHPIVWLMMEKAEVNPLIPAIENVERQLRVVSSLQKAVNG